MTKIGTITKYHTKHTRVNSSMMYYTKNLAEKWRIRFFGKFWSFWLQFCYCHTSINKTIKNGFLSTIILFFVVILSWFVLILVQPQNNRKRTRPIQYIQVIILNVNPKNLWTVFSNCLLLYSFLASVSSFFKNRDNNSTTTQIIIHQKHRFPLEFCH